MPRLTKAFIETELQFPKHGQVFYADVDLPGFGVRVTPHRKCFVAQWRSGDSDRSIVLGSCDEMAPEIARHEASRILTALTDGSLLANDGCESITLEVVFERYLQIRSLRKSTIHVYRDVMNRSMHDWLPMPISRITKDMVESRHRELCRTTRFGTDGKGEANLAMRILRAVLNFAADHYETDDGKPIILVNPVRRLSQNKAWYRIHPRQGVIPDCKLREWYQAVMGLRNRTVADYLLFTLLTGLRRNESITLRWTDVDLSSRVLTVRPEISKNHREHRLPMSPFIYTMLLRRYSQRGTSEFVFHGRGGRGHLSALGPAMEEIRERSNCRFLMHDLRRTFLTMAERMDVPHFALKKLVNHSSTDVTAGYIVVDIERLRMHLSRITDQFLALLFPDVNDTGQMR